MKPPKKPPGSQERKLVHVQNTDLKKFGTGHFCKTFPFVFKTNAPLQCLFTGHEPDLRLHILPFGRTSGMEGRDSYPELWSSYAL